VNVDDSAVEHQKNPVMVALHQNETHGGTVTEGIAKDEGKKTYSAPQSLSSVPWGTIFSFSSSNAPVIQQHDQTTNSSQTDTSSEYGPLRIFARPFIYNQANEKSKESDQDKSTDVMSERRHGISNSRPWDYFTTNTVIRSENQACQLEDDKVLDSVTETLQPAVLWDVFSSHFAVTSQADIMATGLFSNLFSMNPHEVDSRENLAEEENKINAEQIPETLVAPKNEEEFEKVLGETELVVVSSRVDNFEMAPSSTKCQVRRGILAVVEQEKEQGSHLKFMSVKKRRAAKMREVLLTSMS